MLKKIAQNTSLAFCYIILSLLIGECHPFSLESMYNGFAKVATSFYLSDDHGHLLPIQRYCDLDTKALTHYYNSLCEEKNIASTDTTMPLIVRKEIGAAIIKRLEQKRQRADAEKASLHQVYYFMKDDSICSRDILMYGYSR